MKILVITNLYPPDVLGGYEMGCHQIVVALREVGHDVLVLTSAPRVHDGPLEANVSRTMKLADVYDSYTMGKTQATGRIIRHQESSAVQAFNIHRLVQTVERFQPDVVYAWNVIGLGGLGILAAVQHLGLPWVMHLMDDVPKSLCALAANTEPVWPAISKGFTRLCRGRFICCSQNTLDEIEDCGVMITDRTTIIPNWVMTSGTPDRTAYRPNGHLRLLTAGTFGHHKGTHIIIEAAAILRNRGHSHFSIDLYGMGQDQLFRTMIQSERLSMVRILGSRSQLELDRLYPEYDAFLFPTWAREPFGFAPLEATAHGCVAIMSRVCGIAEWLVDGVDCVKVDRDSTSFADAMEAILTGAIPLEEIGRRGSGNILRWFQLKAILPRIETELAAAVTQGGGTRKRFEETYRIAQLAEKMFQSLVYENSAV